MRHSSILSMLTIYSFIFVFVLLGCSDSSSNSIQMNYVEKPPNNFSGKWIVYNKATKKKWIEAEYIEGKKNGIELRWYLNSGDKMSKHTFNNGVLNGPYIKWRNYSTGDILVSGEYKNGKPWNGSFLEDYGLNIDYSLDVIERDEILYTVRFYANGELINRSEIP